MNLVDKVTLAHFWHILLYEKEAEFTPDKVYEPFSYNEHPMSILNDIDTYLRIELQEE